VERTAAAAPKTGGLGAASLRAWLPHQDFLSSVPAPGFFARARPARGIRVKGLRKE